MKSSRHGEDAFDPITLEILWSKLINIVDEAAASLVRSSFSTIVRESNDYCCALLDADGHSLAESSLSIPLFIGSLPRTVQHFLTHFPRDTWEAGDVVITNDPWMGTGHRPDISLAIPVFHQRRLIAFAANVAHASDIGGAIWSADAQDVFEEGLGIPPRKLFRRGEPNEDLFEMIRANVRLPEQVVGDLYAQVASAEVCRRHLLEFIEGEGGQVDLAALGRAVQHRAESVMRKAIRSLPSGQYRYDVETDGVDEPLTIVATLHVEGEAILVDFEGTSPQARRGINCVMNVTHAYTAYSIKCALDPGTPKNEGSYRPVRVTAPEGSMLNPRFPAPVNARGLVAQYITSAVFGALEQAMPGGIIAESGSPPIRFVFAGTGRGGSRFSQIFLPWGGMGARPDKDGISAIAFPSNSGAGSMEVVEALMPLVVWRKALVKDSGGAGRYRGGLGQEFVIEVKAEEPLQLSVLGERITHPARGVAGGLPGGLAGVWLNGTTPIHPKGRTTLRPGDVLTVRYAGGGGYGPPNQRVAADLARDLRDGLVSPAAAKELCGVNS